MTEDQIERLVEKQFDRIDARLMAGKLSQAEYDAEAAEIYLWAEGQYAKDHCYLGFNKIRDCPNMCSRPHCGYASK